MRTYLTNTEETILRYIEINPMTTEYHIERHLLEQMARGTRDLEKTLLSLCMMNFIDCYELNSQRFYLSPNDTPMGNT
jgi:hypothetical protein